MTQIQSQGHDVLCIQFDGHSQAGRRGFDPRHPLFFQPFKDVQVGIIRENQRSELSRNRNEFVAADCFAR